MILVNKHANQSPQDISMVFGKAKKGFFARLFDFIWSNKYAIIGSAFGGIGAAVGAAMDRAASYNNSNKTGFLDKSIVNEERDLFPSEETKLNAFTKNLGKSYQTLINRLDSKINQSQSRYQPNGSVISNEVIEEINKVYFDIACLRANYILLQSQDTSVLSNAKSAVLMSLLETLEKVINTHVKNTDLGSYKIVLYRAVANTNRKVGLINLIWPSKEVKVSVKKYIKINSYPSPDDIIVTPNNGGVDAPILTPEGEEEVNTIEITEIDAPKKYSLLKKAGIGAGIALVIKQLIK